MDGAIDGFIRCSLSLLSIKQVKGRVMVAGISCRVGTVVCRLTTLPLGAATEVNVSIKERTIYVTPDATFEDLSRGIQEAERLELDAAWPPPRLAYLSQP